MTEPLPSRKRPPNPLEGASLYSQLTFSWPYPLIRKGVAKEIKEEDIPEILDDEDSNRNRIRLEQVWVEEQTIASKQGRPASLHRALLRMYFRTLWYVQPAIALTSASRIGQALALGQLIDHFQLTSDHVHAEAFLWAIALIACTFVPLLTHHQTYFRTWRMGMQLRIGAISALYNKSLKLVAVGGGSKPSTAGEMSNLASNDVERFLYASLFISYLFWAPVEALAVLCVGIANLGPAFAAGYIVLFTFVPMQFYLGHRFAISRSEIAAITDQRVNLVSQAIQGVRVMKMSGWELHFAERISNLRKEEVKTIQRASRYRALNEAIFFATNISVAIVIFVVHVLTGHNLTPRDVFTTLTLINLVQFTMTKFFAYSVMSCSECYVSVCRIQQFLELPEIQKIRNDNQEGPIMRIIGVSSYWDSGSAAGSEIDASERSTVVQSSTGNLSQPSYSRQNVENRGNSVASRRSLESEFAARSIALENISLTLQRGHLYCVIGPVGCGKSALLLALAGELEPNVGSIERNTTSVAYVSQAAWIMDGTVKENILMGKEFVSSQYEEVIDACGLRPDIERFHAGDSTLLGDRGIQCSGGQRARIGLARALYRDADLVLLDDPLSAVDSKVARLLFESAIHKMCVARGKCVVLATHQYQLITNESCILMKRGSIIQTAPYLNCIDQSEGLLKSTVKTEGHVIQSDSSNQISDLNATWTDVPAAPKQSESCEKAGKDHDEQKSSGEISMRTWKDYIAALGGKWVVIGILSLFACTQGVLLFTLALIGRWSQRPFDDQSSPNFVVLIVLLGVTVIVLSFVRSVVAFNRAIRASRNLHDSMTLAVLRAKIEFFDTNPLGRILNRFSSDIGSNDDQLPTSLNDTVSIGFIVVGAIASAAAVMPFILVAVPPIFCYFFRIRRMFIGASRELKRFEGMARSPIYGMMSESINGISSIRANGAVEYFQTQFAEVQNAHSRAFFSFIACTRWINFRMEAIQICLLSVASLLAVFVHTMRWFYLDSTILGLSLTLLLQLSGLLQWAVRQSCEVISQMVAVERVAAYNKLESEAPLETEVDALLDPSWPQHGAIAVDGLTVRYRKTLEPALSGLTFNANGGLRIGVVGRTGSGKSTLLQALFRLLEAEQGDVKIDKQDISKLGLHTLRKRMSVIPQTPVLFSGWSLRDNLDPFHDFGDREIIESLSNVQLQDIYDQLPDGLETVVADNGSNFSVGQRQLLCVARAVLQKNKMLVLDEPTANVDQRTDSLLQEAVATSFPGATVVAIAHRLDTIIDYDLILVIGDGKLLEYGSPMELLQQDGQFTAMVADTGPSMSRELHERARAVCSRTES